MKSKRAFVFALAALLLAAGSAIPFASFGGSGGVQVIEVVRDPPDDSGCICPAIWDPVSCRASDGTVRTFSSACVAACHGFTKCRSVAIVP